MSKYSKDDVEAAVVGAKFYSDVCRNLGIAPSGDNYNTIKRLLSEYKIEFNVDPKPWNYGIRYRLKRYDLDDIFENKVLYRNSYSLKKRLIRNNIKKNCCEICGIDGNSVPLELHHINGNHFDNHLENLQILCPNCHSKTDNYRIYNSVKYYRKKKIIPLTQEEIKQIDREKKEKKSKKVLPAECSCEYCGKIFSPRDKNNKYCSVECYRNAQKGLRPPLIVLINDFKELKNFVAVSKKYNVTDNAVRKWCIFYGLPIHTKELLKYIYNPDYVYDKDSIYKGSSRDIDYDKILELYYNGESIKNIAKEIEHTPEIVSKYLKSQNLETRRISSPVNQYDLNNNLIQSFNSIKDAALYIYEQGLAKSIICARHIRESCNNENKTAYGYKWKYF